MLKNGFGESDSHGLSVLLLHVEMEPVKRDHKLVQVKRLLSEYKNMRKGTKKDTLDLDPGKSEDDHFFLRNFSHVPRRVLCWKRLLNSAGKQAVDNNSQFRGDALDTFFVLGGYQRSVGGSIRADEYEDPP